MIESRRARRPDSLDTGDGSVARLACVILMAKDAINLSLHSLERLERLKMEGLHFQFPLPEFGEPVMQASPGCSGLCGLAGMGGLVLWCSR
jgi:hypothetical protein